MKKTITILIFCAVIISAVCKVPAFSKTEDNGAQYLPLRAGNVFYYRYYHCNPGGCDSAFVISRITGSKIFRDVRYYYVSSLFGRTATNYYIRYNPSNGYLVMLDTNNTSCNYEIALYNLAANIGDSVSSPCRSSQYKCMSISDSAIFDDIKTVKRFGYYSSSNGWVTIKGTYFAKDFGCIYDYSSTFNNSYATYSRYLQGCRINNIVYGDTLDHITPLYADSGKYFPVAAGNKWVFDVWRYPEAGWTKEAYKITKDTIIENTKYFYLTGFPPEAFNYTGSWISYDAYSGIIKLRPIIFGMNDNYIKLSSNIGDTLNYVCRRIADTTLFGYKSKIKYFYYNWSGYHANSTRTLDLIRNLGPVFYKYTYSDISDSYKEVKCLLKGCYINGVLYGDTTTVVPTSYTDSSAYFPLKIGNMYYYKRNYTYHSSSPDTTIYDSSYYVIRITDTLRLHGKLYYKMNSVISGTKGYFRNDLDSGFLFSYDSLSWCTNYPYEFKCLMLSSNANQDGSGTCWLNNYYSRCFQIHDTNALGSARKVKGYMTSWGGTSGGHYYTWLLKDIGMCQYEGYSYSYMSGFSATTKFKLIGAFVNGVKYGDTSLAGISRISNTVPDKFSLSQNYPNPFNPNTIIRFQIKNSRMVTLKIYDITGRVLATLVNEKQSPGVYEVTWDASAFPSGVYFYKLTAGDFSEIKKMLLIK